jgi:hypothetical protein
MKIQGEIKIIHVKYCPKFCIHYGQQDLGVGENYITIEFFVPNKTPTTCCMWALTMLLSLD